MKSAWIAAFVLPVLCCSSLFPQQPPSSHPATTPSPDAKAAPQTPLMEAGSSAPLTEQELRQQLLNKDLFLRGLWLSDDLHFDVNGKLVGSSSKGSFTLCDIEIRKVRLTKTRLELEGVRYGIHFQDTGSWGDEAASFERLPITPRKKRLEITIDRQQVAKPKKEKKKKKSTSAAETAKEKRSAAAEATGIALAEKGGAEGITLSPAEAAGRLQGALDRIFAPSLDGKMVAEMPEFWQYFYHAQMAHQVIEPTDPNIVHPGPGIDGPKLLKNVAPPSNEYAQQAKIVGAASYRVILGADGKPMAIAALRPIGFGLDQNAVEAIQRATFAPAMKAGKAVPSVFDISLIFTTDSKLAWQAAPVDRQAPDISTMTGKESVPGLFTVEQASAGQH